MNWNSEHKTDGIGNQKVKTDHIVKCEKLSNDIIIKLLII